MEDIPLVAADKGLLFLLLLFLFCSYKATEFKEGELCLMNSDDWYRMLTFMALTELNESFLVVCSQISSQKLIYSLH